VRDTLETLGDDPFLILPDDRLILRSTKSDSVRLRSVRMVTVGFSPGDQIALEMIGQLHHPHRSHPQAALRIGWGDSKICSPFSFHRHAPAQFRRRRAFTSVTLYRVSFRFCTLADQATPWRWSKADRAPAHAEHDRQRAAIAQHLAQLFSGRRF